MDCDTCGANDKSLVDLRTEYQTTEIKQICPACEKVINDHLWKLRAATQNINKSLLQRFMACLKNRKEGA